MKCILIQNQASEINRNYPAHTLLYHRYTINNVRGFHRLFVVCYYDKLRMLTKTTNKFVELVNIVVI